MGDEAVRVDRWLWAARIFKTRSTAASAVRGGKVHVNGTRAKPAKEVRAGDEIEVTVDRVSRTLIVRAVAERRGPASAAAHLYEETRASVARRERHSSEMRIARSLGQDQGRRPSKRERRKIDAARGRRRPR